VLPEYEDEPKHPTPTLPLLAGEGVMPTGAPRTSMNSYASRCLLWYSTGTIVTVQAETPPACPYFPRIEVLA
jgi:hypothetical protein